MRSGYFLLMSSELRLNTAIVPSASLWTCGQDATDEWKIQTIVVGGCCTCARSPSYLYSHVNFLPSNLSRTSPIAFVGFANIGFRGTTGVSLHSAFRPSMPAFRSAGITRS